MTVSLCVAGRRLRLCHNAAGCSGFLTLTLNNHSTTRSSLIIRSLHDNARVTSSRSKFNPSLNIWRGGNSRRNAVLLHPVMAPRFLLSFSSQARQPPSPPTPARQEKEGKAQQQCEKDNENKPAEPSSSSRRNTSSRRQRHNFLRAPGDLDNVPSFAEFQQQVQIKSLYRQYIRLIYQKFIVTASSSSDKNNKSSSRDEMIAQVRYEFKSSNAKEMSPWDVKRAMSEGSRRYKELSSMLGNSVVVVNAETTAASASDDDDDDDGSKNSLTASSSSLDSSEKSPWPWQQRQTKGTKEDPHHRPSWSLPYPSKSGV